jgi:hypothetical protein
MDPTLAPLLAEHVTVGCVHRLRRLSREWRACVDADPTLPRAVTRARRCRECGRRSQHLYPLHDFPCCAACRADGYRATRRCRPSEPDGYQARSFHTQLHRTLALVGTEVPEWLYDEMFELFLRHVTLERVDLLVPYDEHTTAKHHGAHWDARRRVWYAPPGFSLLFLARWCEGEDVSETRERTRELLRRWS